MLVGFKLTEASDVKKTTKTIKRQKMIKPARVKHVDTGKKQIVEVVEGEGSDRKVTKEERPIIERVSLPPLYEDREEKKQIWTVETHYNGKTEIHEFANPEDAMRFKEGFK